MSKLRFLASSSSNGTISAATAVHLCETFLTSHLPVSPWAELASNPVPDQLWLDHHSRGEWKQPLPLPDPGHSRATTTNYGWDLIATNQASPEVTANSTFNAIDAQVKLPGATSTAPAHHNSTGTAGQMAVDAGNIYFCYATNSWVQISTSGSFSTSF